MNAIVYHGSHRQFKDPDLLKGRKFRDFGVGFYVTEHYIDALNILDQKPGYIYEYELNMEDLVINDLESTEDTAKLIIRNRTIETSSDFDLIVGETLSGCSNIFREVRNKGKQVDLDDIVNLLYKSPYNKQICIKTNKALSKLKLKEIHEYNKKDFY